MKRRSYATDLTDPQWALIEPLLPVRTERRGRQRTHERRELLNALLYLLRSGCSWEQLPHDFPPHPTVYGYFRQWQADGTWERVHRALVEQVRVDAGKAPAPSAGSLDSQTVKTTEKGGRQARSATTPGRKSRVASDTCW
jgi:putative transposase